MFDSEADDEVAELPSLTNQIGLAELTQMVQNEKVKNPSQFVSHWEMDEQDIDEATESEIQNDPVKRVLWAAENGNEEVVAEMLDKRTDLVNATDADGYTPLHRASYEGHRHMVEILLERGADIDARTNDGWTPLHSACNWGQTDCAAALLSNGASINAQTNGLHTPLHLAATNARNREIFQLLLMNPFLDRTLVNVGGETAQDVAERHCPFHRMFASMDSCINVLR